MTDMDRAGGERARFKAWAMADGYTNVVFGPVEVHGVRIAQHVSGVKDNYMNVLDREWSIWREAALSREPLYAHPPAPVGGEGKGGPTSDSAVRLGDLGRVVGPLIDAWEQMPNDLRDERLDRRMGALLAFMEDHRATPAERAAAGLHDAGGVGEAKAAFYERALKFVAAYKAYADAIGNGLPRKGTDVVWADKEQHAKCIDLLIAYDALLAAEARRGESGEAIDAQGGRE